MPQLTRVLIANRGEIAIRIARAAEGLGIESVAVYAAADALSLHTKVATHAVALPGADPVAAYLDADALVALAIEHQCDCLHPGYGFLSESALLAEKCVTAGVTFIGPDSSALGLFGDKVRARTLAQSLGIAVIDGSGQRLDTVAEADAMAKGLGYPVMLKASAGGGGRGMRALHSRAELAEAYERCRSEALAAFGDGSVYLERLIHRPRHIEVQVLGDSHGSVVHLHERDCSVQLRNQKVVEIAPAPNLDPVLRGRMHRDAVRLVQAVGYSNAGTVEFLVAPETGEHWFIECNPRIQVEHTVTEVVTGIDLVEAQFRIASGATLESLGLGDQADVPAARGFAVQARVVAQGMGTMTAYKEPTGPGVRVDACGYAGYTPAPQYDPLFAKVIGSSNSTGSLGSALERTARAVQDFHISGLETNAASLVAILGNETVRDGDARTTLLAEQPDLLATTSSVRAQMIRIREFLDERSSAIGAGATAIATASASGPGLRSSPERRRSRARCVAPSSNAESTWDPQCTRAMSCLCSTR